MDLLLISVKFCPFTFCFQVLSKVPTISINKTDGCHVYLSADSLSCEIVSAKSSEMNILVPNKDGEFVSVPFGDGATLMIGICFAFVILCNDVGLRFNRLKFLLYKTYKGTFFSNFCT